MAAFSLGRWTIVYFRADHGKARSNQLFTVGCLNKMFGNMSNIISNSCFYGKSANRRLGISCRVNSVLNWRILCKIWLYCTYLAKCDIFLAALSYAGNSALVRKCFMSYLNALWYKIADAFHLCWKEQDFSKTKAEETNFGQNLPNRHLCCN